MGAVSAKDMGEVDSDSLIAVAYRGKCEDPHFVQKFL